MTRVSEHSLSPLGVVALPASKVVPILPPDFTTTDIAHLTDWIEVSLTHGSHVALCPQVHTAVTLAQSHIDMIYPLILTLPSRGRLDTNLLEKFEQWKNFNSKLNYIIPNLVRKPLLCDRIVPVCDGSSTRTRGQFIDNEPQSKVSHCSFTRPPSLSEVSTFVRERLSKIESVREKFHNIVLQHLIDTEQVDLRDVYHSICNDVLISHIIVDFLRNRSVNLSCVICCKSFRTSTEFEKHRYKCRREGSVSDFEITHRDKSFCLPVAFQAIDVDIMNSVYESRDITNLCLSRQFNIVLISESADVHFHYGFSETVLVYCNDLFTHAFCAYKILLSVIVKNLVRNDICLADNDLISPAPSSKPVPEVVDTFETFDSHKVSPSSIGLHAVATRYPNFVLGVRKNVLPGYYCNRCFMSVFTPCNHKCFPSKQPHQTSSGVVTTNTAPPPTFCVPTAFRAIGISLPDITYTTVEWFAIASIFGFTLSLVMDGGTEISTYVPAVINSHLLVVVDNHNQHVYRCLFVDDSTYDFLSANLTPYSSVLYEYTMPTRRRSRSRSMDRKFSQQAYNDDVLKVHRSKIMQINSMSSINVVDAKALVTSSIALLTMIRSMNAAMGVKDIAVTKTGKVVEKTLESTPRDVEVASANFRTKVPRSVNFGGVSVTPADLAMNNQKVVRTNRQASTFSTSPKKRTIGFNLGLQNYERSRRVTPQAAAFCSDLDDTVVWRSATDWSSEQPFPNKLRDELKPLLHASCEGWSAATTRRRPVPGVKANNFGARTLRKANNFGANNFEDGDTGILTSMLAAHGLRVPCSSLTDCMMMMAGVCEGTLTHPKRFGDDTFVLYTNATNIVSLSATPYVSGNTLYIVTVVNDAFKGAVVIQMPPGAASLNTSSVVAYVSPDRDPEQLGTRLNVLFCEQQISLPQVVGGTNVTVANTSLQNGVTDVFPPSIVPGKLASVCRGRRAPIAIIGSETHCVREFTACEPEAQIRVFNRFDPQNTLVRVPGTLGVPQICGAFVEESQAFAIVAPAGATGAASQRAGWILPFVTGFVQTISVTALTFTPIWTLNQHTDCLRHMLYGAFTILSAGTLTCAVNLFLIRRYQITYSDGTTSFFDAEQNLAPALADSYTDWFDTRGQSSASGNLGKIIVNIQYGLIGGNGIPPTNVSLAVDNLVVRFHDVRASTKYLCTILTGAQTAVQLNIVVNIHTEVRPDPSSTIALYVTPTSDLPYDAELLPRVLKAMEMTGSSINTSPVDSNDYQAGVFQDIGNFFKKVVGFLAPVAGPVANLLFPGSGAIVGPVANGINQALSSASFGTNVQNIIRTGFTFPLVGVSPNSYKATIGDIILGDGHDPNGIGLSFDNRLTVDPVEFVGESYTFALFLAYLHRAGWPAVKGMYTGEVDQVAVTQNTASFRLSAVMYTAEKYDTFNQLTAYAPSGFLYKQDLYPEPSQFMFFGALRSFEYQRVAPPRENPVTSFMITIVKY